MICDRFIFSMLLQYIQFLLSWRMWKVFLSNNSSFNSTTWTQEDSWSSCSSFCSVFSLNTPLSTGSHLKANIWTNWLKSTLMLTYWLNYILLYFCCEHFKSLFLKHVFWQNCQKNLYFSSSINLVFPAGTSVRNKTF